MTLDLIFEDVNLQCDETMSSTELIPFFNDGISYINRRKHTNYPYLSAGVATQTEYTALKETWLRQIVINYMCHLVKTVDSSQFEYTDFLRKCEDAMGDFMQIKDPDAYAPSDDDGGEDGGGVQVYQADNTNNIMNRRW